MQPGGAGEVPARRGDAALVLLLRGAEGLRGSGRRGQFLRDRRLGLRVDPDVNPLQGIGASPKDAELAQAAIDKGRKMGAKTQRERDYLEAVAAYYEDFANRPERARQLARAKAYEALAAKYPDDDEAQIFYALYLAGTQTASDQTYAAYLKAAGDPREAVREVSRPSGRRALPDPQLRRAADRRSRACPRRAATPASRRTRRTRCTCPRTSSPASARGPIRWRPTAARPTSRRRATSPTRRCTRWTT